MLRYTLAMMWYMRVLRSLRSGIRYHWGNLALAMRWNYILSPQLFMNITGSFTRYRNNLNLSEEMSFQYMGVMAEDKIEAQYNSGIRDLSLRCDFDYAPAPEHAIKFGGVFIHHIFSPEVMGGKMTVNDVDTSYVEEQKFGGNNVLAQEMSLYVEDDWSVSDALKVNAGLVLGGFMVEGKFRPSLQPRLSGRLMLANDLSLKAGYAYMTQYMHLLSSSNISLPTDLWVPVTSRLDPMTSHQVAAGLVYSRWGVDFSVEGYYKWMNNLMEYRPGSSFFGVSTGWEDKVCLGKGRAYGVEFLAHKTMGKFTGWVGYTLSRTLRQFDELNEGREYPAKYDRIHDVSVTLQYRPSEKFDCGVTWVFATGNTATLALQEYEGVDNGDYRETYGYFSERNNFRLPSYHRMDVSMNFHKKKKHGVRTWNISVYNLYNRQNPYIILKWDANYTAPDGNTYRKALMQMSLFPIIPSVAYIYKF